MKNAILIDLNNKYTQSDVIYLINKAVFLDPRFKTLSFLTDSERNGATLAEQKAIRLAASLVAEHVDKEPEPPPKRPKEGGLTSLLDGILSSPTSNVPSPQQKASNEMQKYLASTMPVIRNLSCGGRTTHTISSYGKIGTKVLMHTCYISFVRESIQYSREYCQCQLILLTA